MSALQAPPARQGFERHLVAVWSVCVMGGLRRSAPDGNVQKKAKGGGSTVLVGVPCSLSLTASARALFKEWGGGGRFTQFSPCLRFRLTLL